MCPHHVSLWESGLPVGMNAICDELIAVCYTHSWLFLILPGTSDASFLHGLIVYVARCALYAIEFAHQYCGDAKCAQLPFIRIAAPHYSIQDSPPQDPESLFAGDIPLTGSSDKE